MIKIETLHVGTRKWKSSFLEFYNKYLDIIDKESAKAEDKCFLVIGTDMRSELRI